MILSPIDQFLKIPLDLDKGRTINVRSNVRKDAMKYGVLRSTQKFVRCCRHRRDEFQVESNDQPRHFWPGKHTLFVIACHIASFASSSHTYIHQPSLVLLMLTKGKPTSSICFKRRHVSWCWQQSLTRRAPSPRPTTVHR